MTPMEGNAALATRGLNQAELVKELRKQVTALEDDLRVRSDEVEEFATALRAEYDEARAAQRTAATYGAWRDERVTQVAAAWVLGTVFVRFCEDNGLIEWPFLAGPGERLADAEERHEAFFRANPQFNDRDWIVAAFDHLASTHPTVAGLFHKRYNPLWEITPTFEAATSLIGFWRRRGGDGEIQFDFTDPNWDTRFLGDLYQDLSEHARKTYALLQTPEFVEEFILDLTFEPAVQEFGLKNLRTIDPACGSGHFLLGIFVRLLSKWRSVEPGADDWELIRRSMKSVHGCDKNPFAASIARFRLLIAALHAAKQPRLSKASIFPINVAVGDSLLHGRGAPGVQIDLFDSAKKHAYRTEDVEEYVQSCDLLARSSYHVVVGNPPYITVKDKQENENYRNAYKKTCSGKYALSVPFAECLFQLAVRTHGSDRKAGFVSQITANSFMKREFGKKLIEDFLPTVHLTHVIDTSGAHIPGHGTPTVILVGRNHVSRAKEPIRAALGVRAEPSQPAEPSSGLVWSAIVDQVGKPRSESQWISIEDADRRIFAKHPWSLSGGGAGDVVEFITKNTEPLSSQVRRLGVFGMTNADEVMLAPLSAWTRQSKKKDYVKQIILGDEVRDWSTPGDTYCFFPYTSDLQLVPLESIGLLGRWMWPHRTTMGNRATFSKGTYFSDGRPWHEWHQITSTPGGHTWSITFAEVATHNHFALDRKGKAFKQTAPVIKLANDTNEDSHLELLGLLNSSTVCYLLKEFCFPKGGSGMGRGIQPEDWMDRYAFNSSNVGRLPIPKELPGRLGRALDSHAQQLSETTPSMVCEANVPDREALSKARNEQEAVRARMIALQEELDWQVYSSYSLLGDAESARLTTPDIDSLPQVGLGERAFEIALARKVAAGEVETAWFKRHGSIPITEIPTRWPSWYREIVQARIDVIEKRRDIALIERPECKRRWTIVSWEKREAEALCTWLLNRCENPDLWSALRDGMKQPRALTVNQLADKFRDDADMRSVAQLYAIDHLGKRDLTLAQVLDQVVADQHVPYLAAMRYKDSGLRKRAEWEEVWETQREEDRTGQRLDIPIPPTFGSGDFRKASYWSQRGKLDVPKERFISYPDANPNSDSTLLLGWAGWDHKDQAQALVNIINDRVEQSGWGQDKITPLLAGLQELMPWLNQWHGEYDDEWGGIPAEEYSAYLTSQRTTHQLTEDDLREWRPAAPTRGRRAAKKG